LIFWCLAS
jgi:benzoate membrane transport protein